MARRLFVVAALAALCLLTGCAGPESQTVEPTASPTPEASAEVSSSPTVSPTPEASAEVSSPAESPTPEASAEASSSPTPSPTPVPMEVLFDIVVSPPTCQANGYSIYVNKESGGINIRDEVPRLPHEWIEVDGKTVCRNCGTERNEQN